MTTSGYDSRASDRALIRSMRDFGTFASASRGEALCHEGEKTRHVSVLASGYAVAVKRTAAGHQQNVAIYVPGDIVDHGSFALATSRSGAIALTALTFHKVPHVKLRDLIDEHPDLSQAFCRSLSFHCALAHEWLLSLGRRSAYMRTAHLLCEVICRSSAADGSAKRSCDLPMTQTELADLLGLSVVHVNRTLMRLRQEGLVRHARGRIEVLDWPRMTEAAGFDPAYLDTVE